MELILSLCSTLAVIGLVWLITDAFDPRPPQIININGRKYRIVGTLNDTRVKIRRTFGQWVKDKWTGARRRVGVLLASLGLYACGGAEFSLADPNQTDAGSTAPDAARVTYVDPYVDPPDAQTDAGIAQTSDAQTKPDAQSDVASAEALAPGAPACTSAAWDCGGAFIPPGRICINHRDVAGVSHPGAASPPAACDTCPLSCACLIANVECGIYNGGPIEHLVGCAEAQPNQTEVTCQD